MESQCAVSHVMQDTSAQASTTTLERDPVVDPQPTLPGYLTFVAQDTVADVAETAIIDHGSHIVGIPVKGHFQEAGRTQNEEHYDRGEGPGTTDGGTGCWAKGPATPGGGVSEEFPKGRNSGRRQRGERRLGWWIGRESNSERAGLGKTQKENQWSDSTEEHLRVVGKGEEGMQAHQSEQHPGELVKNLFGEIE